MVVRFTQRQRMRHHTRTRPSANSSIHTFPSSTMILLLLLLLAVIVHPIYWMESHWHLISGVCSVMRNVARCDVWWLSSVGWSLLRKTLLRLLFWFEMETERKRMEVGIGSRWQKVYSLRESINVRPTLILFKRRADAFRNQATVLQFELPLRFS